MRAEPVSAEWQLQFLSKLQRVFAEGEFTATYKFALLVALADLAVELGADDDRSLRLTNRQIGLRFIALYWKQSLPYGSGHPGSVTGVLIQNKGDQAAVISAIRAFREQTNITSLIAALRHPNFKRLLGTVSATVSAQPLAYLQNFGGATDTFLYDRVVPGAIELKPGVAYCLRRFYPLIQQLCRSHWIGHIKQNRRNHPLLGDTGDLEGFLFSASRQSLAAMGSGLRKLEGNVCFYCGKALRAVDVDHYIPFSLYPRDLAHNFVLAHPRCNRSKSDTLAARPHLERWLERLRRHADALTDIGAEAGFVTDPAVVRTVGAWAYANAFAVHAQGWLSANRYTPIVAEDVYCFG